METKITIQLTETVEFTDIGLAQNFIQRFNDLLANANSTSLWNAPARKDPYPTKTPTVLTPTPLYAPVTTDTPPMPTSLKTVTTSAVEPPVALTEPQVMAVAASVQSALTTQLSIDQLANVPVPTDAQIKEAMARVREDVTKPRPNMPRNEITPPAPRQTLDWTDASTDKSPTPVVVTDELRNFGRLREVVTYLIERHNIRSRRALIDACKALTREVPLLANMDLEARVPKAVDVIDSTIGA